MPISENSVEIKLLSSLVLVLILSDNMIQLINSSLPEKPEKNQTKPHSVIKCNPQKICICPEDPLTSRYPDPTDPSCERYFLCHMGFAFQKKCDVRKAFHAEKKECVSRSQVSFHDCPPPVLCGNNGVVEDPKDCTKYYICFYMQAYHYACKVKHYYDPATTKCILNQTQTDICIKKGFLTQNKTTTTTMSPLSLLSNAVDVIST